MKKDPKIFIEHILESIEEIEKYSLHATQETFSKMTMMQDAIIRRIEIIGEATKKLPKPFKGKYPKMPWKEMAGMRDRLIHFYFGIDYKLVWETIKKKIPEVKPLIEKILKELERELE